MQHRDDDDDDHDDSWVKSNSLLPVSSSSSGSGAGEQGVQTQGRGGGCCRFNVVGRSVRRAGAVPECHRYHSTVHTTTALAPAAPCSARCPGLSVTTTRPAAAAAADAGVCVCVCVCVCGSRARQKFPSRPVLSADVRSADHCELRSAAEVTGALDLLCGSVQAHVQSAPGPIYKLSHDNLTIILPQCQSAVHQVVEYYVTGECASCGIL